MTLVNELLDFYKQNDEAFVNDIEQLDSYTGYAFEMGELEKLYEAEELLEVLRRAFYGYDDDDSTPDQKAPFNPNRDYFYFNEYGNLVSTNSRNNNDTLNEKLVRDIIDNRFDLNLSDGAQKIIEKYEDQEEK